MVSFNHPLRMLPHPALGIFPFHTQAYPIPDPLQVHTGSQQRAVVTSPYGTPNNLPMGRFLGTSWVQNNQPQFLGANERIIFR
jgi:hypothetical protein